MIADTLVKVEGVSKKFCHDLKRSLWYGFKDLSNELLGRRLDAHSELRQDEFWAVKNVSFELRRGECLGLIGHNGAGKTTLLRMLNGLIKPDEGRIEMRGRVAALIALGAGFSPILTGRENIYVNASVLGLTKREIDQNIDEIIDFAELGDFIDAPVQSYSSGMQVRLGFSIASMLSPDILILDEILAVGDASFRSKCYRKISACKKNAAVIFVSHNMEQVARICTTGLVFKSGNPEFQGNVMETINRYNSILNQNIQTNEESFCRIYPPITCAELTRHYITVSQGSDCEVAMYIESEHLLEKCWARLVIFNSNDSFAADLDLKVAELTLIPGKLHLYIRVANLRLRSGIYKLGINVFTNEGDILLWSYKQVTLEMIGQNHVGNADYQPAGSASILHEC
ncbi:ABC transporter ATP-binding protein [Geobacter anodireducens]